jgi:hypothetical protein
LARHSGPYDNLNPDVREQLTGKFAAQVKTGAIDLVLCGTLTSLRRQLEDTIMQTVVRTYSGQGGKKLFDVLEKHPADVEKLLRSIKGFVGYTLARSSDGGIYTLARSSDGGLSVTVCQHKAGVDESIQKAQDWIAKNAESTGVAEAKISEGTVIVHLK